MSACPLRTWMAAVRCLPLVLCLAALSSCSTAPSAAVSAREFFFERDTFAYPNELVWEYRFDDHGRWTSKPREPKPDYTHRCFVVVRAARQFFGHARFDPSQPVADAATYRRLIRRVISASPRTIVPETEKVLVPGYANLREFSRAEEG